MKFFNDVIECFANGKYLSSMVDGLWLTFIISVGATVIGLLLGTLVALVGLSKSKNPLMILPRAVCNIYVCAKNAFHRGKRWRNIRRD